MDAPHGPAQRVKPEPEIRLSDPGAVAAALPRLLGFRPRESLVLVGLNDGLVGLTARADLPAPVDAAPAGRSLAGALARSGATAAILAVVSSAGGQDDAGLPHRPLVHQVVLALSALDLPVHDVLLVRRGRWWSYDCPHACCAPGAGTPLPAGTSELDVRSVTEGQVLADDRDELVHRLASAPDPAGVMASAVLRIGRDCATAVLARGRDAVAGESWDAVRTAVARLRAGPVDRPGEDEIARVAWALRDVEVRDRALGLVLGPDAAAAEQLWRECARRVPAPLDSAPATLLAVAVWLRGDGTSAGIALDRALDSDPGYPLARLLDEALAGCLSPAQLRAMVAGAVATGDRAG
jgi:hypothetical protein